MWRTSENNASDVFSNSYYSTFLINTAVDTNAYPRHRVLSGTEDGVTRPATAGPTIHRIAKIIRHPRSVVYNLERKLYQVCYLLLQRFIVK